MYSSMPSGMRLAGCCGLAAAGEGTAAGVADGLCTTLAGAALTGAIGWVAAPGEAGGMTGAAAGRRGTSPGLAPLGEGSNKASEAPAEERFRASPPFNTKSCRAMASPAGGVLLANAIERAPILLIDGTHHLDQTQETLEPAGTWLSRFKSTSWYENLV